MKEVTLRCEDAKPLQVSVSSEGFAVTLTSGFSGTGAMGKHRTLYNTDKHIPCITTVKRAGCRHFSNTLLHSMTSQISWPDTDTLLSLWPLPYMSMRHWFALHKMCVFGALCFSNVCVFHLRPARRQKLQDTTSHQLAPCHHLARHLQLSLLNTSVT